MSACATCAGPLERGVCPACGLTITKRARPLGYRDEADKGPAVEIVRSRRVRLRPSHATGVAFFVYLGAALSALAVVVVLAEDADVFCVIASLLSTILFVFAYLESRSRRAREAQIRAGTLAIERWNGSDYRTLARMDDVDLIHRVGDRYERYRIEVQLLDRSRIVVLDELTDSESARVEEALREQLEASESES